MNFLHRLTRDWSSVLLLFLLFLAACNADNEFPTKIHLSGEEVRQGEATAASTEGVRRENLAPVISEKGEARQSVKYKSGAPEVTEEIEFLKKEPMKERVDWEASPQRQPDRKQSKPVNLEKEEFDVNPLNVKPDAETGGASDDVSHSLPSAIEKESEFPPNKAQASSTSVEPEKLQNDFSEVVNVPQPMDGAEETKRSDYKPPRGNSDNNQRAMKYPPGENAAHIISDQTETSRASAFHENSAHPKAKDEKQSVEPGSSLSTELTHGPEFPSPMTNVPTNELTGTDSKTVKEFSTLSEVKRKEEKSTEADTAPSFSSSSDIKKQPSDAESVSTQNGKGGSFSSPTETEAETSFFPTFAQNNLFFRSLVTSTTTRVELSRMYYRVVREIYEAGNLTAAVEAMHDGALHGHGRLHWILGVLYANGVGVPHSDAKAILHFTFAALESIPEAHMALGYRYAEGIGVEKKCETAVAHYREAADAVALTYDGFPNTVEVAKDTTYTRYSASGSTTSLHMLMFRADAGATDAIIALGYVYFKGQMGAARDWRRAEKLFLSALDRGDAAAFGALGQLYASGDLTSQPPVARDIAKAGKFFAQGAEKHDAISLNGMGYLHALGYYEKDAPIAQGSGPQSLDYASAARYFTESANRGSKEGMYNLGVLHLHGRGVAQDVELAMRLFEKAAARGSVLSFWQLARNEQSKGNCQRALQLYTHVASLSSFFDRNPGTSYVVSDDASPNDATESSPSWHFPPPVENSLGYFIGTLALAETGHGPSRWAAAQLLEDGVTIVEETSEELNGTFAASGRPPTRAVQGNNVVWMHWLHADEKTNGNFVLLAQREAMQMLQLRLYELCALSGQAEANLRLGDFYYYGESRLIGVNMARALMYYDAAARKQNAKALFCMGFMYQMGLGLTDNHQEIDLATALYHMVTNTPFRDEEKEETDEAAEMRLYMAKRYYDKALEANPEAALYAVNIALISLNFQWWWRHYSALPYGLSEGLRLPMPFPRDPSQSRPVDFASETGENETEYGEESAVDDPDALGLNDYLLWVSGLTLFILLLLRHHGA